MEDFVINNFTVRIRIITIFIAIAIIAKPCSFLSEFPITYRYAVFRFSTCVSTIIHDDSDYLYLDLDIEMSYSIYVYDLSIHRITTID